MIQHIGAHLPVYKIQQVDENTKIRILHRNLLFPLTERNKSDEKQNLEEREPKLTNFGEEKHASSDEHVNNYEGPITRSKTKKDRKCIYTQN